MRRAWWVAVLLAASMTARAEETAAQLLAAEVGRALDRLHACAAAWKPETDGDARMSGALRAALAWEDGEKAPAGLRERAAMIALALFVDDSGMYAKNPLGGAPFAARESPERRAKAREWGRTTSIHARHDWAQHWVVSAALALQLNPELSLQAGYAKELSDAKERETGPASGFSFADLEADYAGVQFARRLRTSPAPRLRVLAGSTIHDFTPDLREMPEEFTYSEFMTQFGGLHDGRYREMVGKIMARITACPGYAEPGK